MICHCYYLPWCFHNKDTPCDLGWDCRRYTFRLFLQVVVSTLWYSVVQNELALSSSGLWAYRFLTTTISWQTEQQLCSRCLESLVWYCTTALKLKCRMLSDVHFVFCKIVLCCGLKFYCFKMMTYHYSEWMTNWSFGKLLAYISYYNTVKWGLIGF